MLQSGVLYRVEDNGTLRVIAPEQSRQQLFAAAHGGKFGAHLSAVKVYSELRRHYWWAGMRRDVSRWTRACLMCATRITGRLVWDERLPYVLFAYRASQQSSMQESPFYLLYGMDPRLPVPAALSPETTRVTTNLKEYGLEFHMKMAQAWELARASVGRAQRRQKVAYDQKSREPSFREGERVFLYKPAENTGEERKFARPFHGPYCVMEMSTNTAKIQLVDRPEGEPLLVSLERLRRCPEEIGVKFWPPDKKATSKKTTPVSRRKERTSVSSAPGTAVHPVLPQATSCQTVIDPGTGGKLSRSAVASTKKMGLPGQLEDTKGPEEEPDGCLQPGPSDGRADSIRCVRDGPTVVEQRSFVSRDVPIMPKELPINYSADNSYYSQRIYPLFYYTF